jgi:hypothetical protein
VDAVHPPPADPHVALGRFQQSRDQVQDGGLAATRRAEKDKKFPSVQFQVDAFSVCKAP